MAPDTPLQIPNEDAEFDAWLREAHTGDVRLSAIQHVLRYPEPPTAAPASDLWMDFRTRYLQSEQSTPRVSKDISSAITRFGIGVAVAIISIVATLHVAHRSGKLVPEVRYATGTGQRATVTLTDGSRVTLAPQTTLRLAPSFGVTTRSIQLDGEAYFEVRHTNGAPFVVQTGSITTRVLGTAFNVRKYTSDATARVAVVQGKVVVSAQSAKHPTLTLTAGTVGDISDSTAQSQLSDDVASYTTWTHGYLVLHDAQQAIHTIITSRYAARGVI